LALLSPFRALRPTPEAAAHVAAVPYDVVNAEEAAAFAHGNPLSFLHVSRAEIDLPAGTDPYSDAVYQKAAANFASLKAAAPLLVEDAPSVYVYRLRMRSHTQTGVAACYSLDEYDRDLIKKHERTRRDKEDDRTRHMLELRAQTGPVFLVYKDSEAVDRIVERVTAAPPLLDFTAVDDIQHTLWRTAAADQGALVMAFGQIPALYIADGHHRAASAARARQQLRGATGAEGAWDTFLAVAFPGNQTQILPYNRIVKDLASQTPDALLGRLRERYQVQAGGATPAAKGEVGMYLAGRWYAINLGPNVGSADPAGQLDVSRLQDGVLGPMLGIGDVRTDKRIDFVGGARGVVALEKAVDSGAAAVAFSLHPVGVSDLMQIADAGGIMPPKSTWFEPKLRDGLLSHLI
jgi:uncharacterized protein (DUF1015 family)